MPSVMEIAAREMGFLIEAAQATTKYFPGPVYNVKGFGAAADGVTDDAPAFQAAFNAVYDANGGTVYVPYGEYKLGSLLRIYRNTKLVIEPGTRLIRAHDGAMLINGDLGAEYPNYSGNGNIIIDGGIWDGNVLEYNTSGFNILMLARGQNIIVKNAEFRDVIGGHAIDMSACQNVLIERCRFLGFIDPGDRYFSEAVEISEHTELGFPEFGPFDGTPCRNITVRNCYFGASGTPGTQAWAVGVGNHLSYYNQFNENIRVYDNEFDGMTFVCVRLFKYANSIVRGNRFKNCVDAIRFSNPDGNGVYDSGVPQSGKNAIIEANHFSDITGYGVYVVGNAKDGVVSLVEGVRIKNNIFENVASKNCIHLRFVKDVIIGKNVYRNVYRGVNIEYGSAIDVDGNILYDVINEGVYVNDADETYRFLYTKDHIYRGNKIYRCGRTGLFIQHVNGFLVLNNQIFEPAIETDNTRNGIMCANVASNGLITGNRVVKAQSGNQNKYGIEVTPTCSNVRVFNNDVDGKTGKTSVTTANGCFEGFFVHSPNGTRYKVTVTDAGAISVTAG